MDILFEAAITTLVFIIIGWPITKFIVKKRIEENDYIKRK